MPVFSAEELQSAGLPVDARAAEQAAKDAARDEKSRKNDARIAQAVAAAAAAAEVRAYPAALGDFECNGVLRWRRSDMGVASQMPPSGS